MLAFGDEEGVRFPKTLFGSSTVAGVFDPTMLDLVDAAGVKIGDALPAFGGDPAALPGRSLFPRRHDRLPRGPYRAGAGARPPGEPLAVVSAIAGQSRYRLGVKGEAGHAGTVPMAIRHDALAAAAEAISAIEEIAEREPNRRWSQPSERSPSCPARATSFPGEVRFSLDIRASDDRARQAAINDIRARIRHLAARRGVAIGMELVHEKPVAACAPRLRRASPQQSSR